MGFKELRPGVPPTLVWDTTRPRFLQVIEIQHFGQCVQTFDSLTVGANTYRSRTAINKHEGIGEGKEGVWINDCIVWCETVKGEERICKEKSVSELCCCNNNNNNNNNNHHHLFSRTHLNVMLYVYCLSCFQLIIDLTNKQRIKIKYWCRDH